MWTANALLLTIKIFTTHIHIPRTAPSSPQRVFHKTFYSERHAHRFSAQILRSYGSKAGMYSFKFLRRSRLESFFHPLLPRNAARSLHSSSVIAGASSKPAALRLYQIYLKYLWNNKCFSLDKRIFNQRSGFSSTFWTITKATRAVSVSCYKSNITHRLLGLIIGHYSWANGGYAEAKEMQYDASLYSNERLGNFVGVLLEAIILAFRMMYLMLLFTPALLSMPIGLKLEGRFRELWLRLIHTTLAKAGAAFIKWGQWAATRPDLFPRDLCNELAKLQAKAPAHSFSHTERSIEKAFGKKIGEIFESFDTEPVASGSIAQVHKATLRNRPSKVVAVKVRHPGVSEVIRRDFEIINLVAKVSSHVPALQWLRLEESVQQFAVFMLSQVDLAREAAQLSRFLYNFRRCKGVSFPKPLYPLVHPAVLVETYEQGESVARYVDQPETDNRLNKSLAHIGTHSLFKMLLVDNFIHADMHPGNILVRVGKNNPSHKQLFRSKPHVIFLDVGMTAELAPKDRVNLLEFFKAVVLRDGRTVAQCTLNFSKNQSCPDRKAFIEGVEESFKLWDSPKGDKMNPAECIHDLLDQVRCHRVNIDGDVCTVIVTTLVLEGWQRKLDPDYNVMATLQKLLFKAEWAESLSYTIDGLMAP